MAFTRRELLAGATGLVLTTARRTLGWQRSTVSSLRDLEARLGGRLGVAALDTASGRRLAFRDTERFPMCSTFKWLLAAQVLARVETGQERLDRFVTYGPADLLDYAPVTRAHVAEGGLSVEALAAAAVEVSDNTAANLLLASIDGPSGLTAFIRGLHDEMTRLDRTEPALNSAEPGDPRDTTTPAAMVKNLQMVLLGSRLGTASRDRLVSWLLASTTGASKLRAGIPAGWRVGDKTGNGAHGANNDVAIIWPPDRAPILVAAYSVGSTASQEARDAALAEVARIIVRAIG